MERRIVIAVVLAIGVLFLTPRLFPPAPRSTPVTPSAPDITAPQTRPEGKEPTVEQQPVETPTAVDSARVRADSIVVQVTQATHVLGSVGAALEHVWLREYQALNGDTSRVRLDGSADPLVSYSLVTPNDTVHLDRAMFIASYDTSARMADFRSHVDGWLISIQYVVNQDGYLVRTTGEVRDTSNRVAGDSVFVALKLPRSLESFEANVVEDRRGLGVSFKPRNRGASQIGLGSLDPNERRIEPGPLRWVVLKSKYFLVGVIAVDSTTEFAELQVTGLAPRERDSPEALISVLQRLSDGKFAFDIYAGPQKWDAMGAVGREFQGATPYGGWLQPVVQPFATIVMRVLLWMHSALNLQYGWVLLLFGVLVRIAMWPLNQRAMRSSLKMQELQPLLSEVQKRYKSDPQRMSAETMRVYKEHGMSPFSPLAGCFPILLSMPVLFALFFVFQSTIEFRGVPFLWLGDISLKDPYYIAPLLMGGSMFFTSWMSMRSLPPNPQTRIMTYVLPVMMTVFLANMASGLNLYWAAQNVASIPQQWLIMRERAKAKARKAK